MFVFSSVAPAIPSAATFAPLFSRGAVLQRNRPIPVFGTGVPGSPVKVRFRKQLVAGTVGRDGSWRVLLASEEAGGPESLELTSPGGRSVVTDVAVGEVWLAAGQSNMEWPVSASDVLDLAKDPLVRTFRVRRASLDAPASVAFGEWTASPSVGARATSAVATAFALHLRRKLGVPIGIVQATWGGTRIESWISNGMLETAPESRRLLDEYVASLYDFDDRLDLYRRASAEFAEKYATLDAGRTEAAQGWEFPTLDADGWSDEVEDPEFAGVSWLRAEIDVPATWLEARWRVTLTGLRGSDRTFLDGSQIGASRNGTGRGYFVDRGVGHREHPLLAVRLFDPLPEAPPPPRVLVTNLATGEELSLAPKWKRRVERPLPPVPEGVRPTYPLGPGHRNAISGAFSGMIAPTLPYATRGTIFYQGEANVDAPALYRTLFRELIQDWRMRSEEPRRPFLFVQLPGYTGGPTWPALREAQAAALDLPATEMAVSYDLGSKGTIHPIEKAALGERLARIALFSVYRRTGTYRSPRPVATSLEGSAMRVEFPSDVFLKTADGAAVRGVTAAGNDRLFFPAEATIAGSNLMVRLPAKRVSAVRIAWQAAPDTNLIDARTDLPVAPFRSDDWPIEP